MANKNFLTVFIAMIFMIVGYAQQKTITGNITSEGSPLPGVNVVVKGTTNGVISDFDGNYSIDNVLEESTLVFTFIGFETLELIVDSESVLNAVMQEGSEQLDEVVVVGFGTQKKKDITGAIGTISQDDITRTPSTSIDQSLGGQIAGVYIARRAGDAAAPITVRIRGVGTTGNNQPLYVVDGVPLVQSTNQTVNTGSNTESNPLATINPNDIESINVLKDASAAAIYGARAANGVVIITTKKGRNGKAEFVFDVYTSTTKNDKKYSTLNTEQYIDYQDELQAQLGDGHDFSQFRGDPTYDWQDAISTRGSTNNYFFGASGGSDVANYAISAGYMDQEGIELAQSFERFSFSANSEIKVGKWLKVGESIQFSTTDRLVQSEPGAAPSIYSATNVPFFAIYDDEGNYNRATYETVGDASWNTGDKQVVGLNDLYNNETRVKTNRLIGNVNAQIEFFKGFKWRGQVGLDYSVGEGQWFQNDYDFGDGEGNSSGQSLLTKERPIETTINISNILTYDTSFGNGDHNLSLMFGMEETHYEFTKLRGQGLDLINTSVKMVHTGASASVTEEADEWAIRGYLGRVNYNYKGKYLVTANLRRDETSRFSSDNRADYFPSLALGWRMSEESFMENSETINDFKLRVSWGETGNQFTGANNAYLSQLGLTSAYVLGPDQTVIIAPASIVLANPDLRWETSTQTNIGVDMALFDNRLSFILDYYVKNTENVLVGVPFPAVTGFALPTDVNLGEIKNSGFEFTVNYNNTYDNGFTWGVNANISTLTNKVVNLGGVTLLAGAFGSQISRTVEGESMAHFYGYKTDGLYQTQAEADAALPDDESFDGASPGDIRFVDVNNDGFITAEDKTNIGTPLPTYYYGLTFNADYKNFYFSIFFQGVGGNSVYNEVRVEMEGLDGYSNQLTSTENRWTGEGTSNSFPRLDGEGQNNNNRFSERWVENGAYTRLKNIQIGYNFNSEMLQKAFKGIVSNIRIYGGAQNVAVWTEYSGLDPEVTRAFSFQKGENNLSFGVDDGYATPQAVSYQIGTRITF